MGDFHIPNDPNWQWAYDAILYTVGEEFPKGDPSELKALSLELERFNRSTGHSVTELCLQLGRDRRAPQLPEIASDDRWTDAVRELDPFPVELADGPPAIEGDERVAHRVEHVRNALARALRRLSLAREILAEPAEILIRVLQLDGLLLHLLRLGAELLVQGLERGKRLLPPLVRNLTRGEHATEHRVDEQREQPRQNDRTAGFIILMPGRLSPVGVTAFGERKAFGPTACGPR